MLLGGMNFVGSLLTNKLTSSLLLLGMFIYWSFCALFTMPKEFKIERMERQCENLKFDMIIKSLENLRREK